MDVRPGYKQTEVGMIPEDWEIKRLEEIASVSSGGTPSRHNQAYWGGDIPWVTTTQIDSNLIVEANEFITVVGLQNSATKVYVAGTLLMAMYGQGKTRGKVAILGIDAAINQACAAIKLDKSVSHGYVCSNLAARYEEIRGLSNTGNQENLNSQIIKNILVPLPPLPEQCAIAEALSDADALIESLEQLIAKKQQVKQGAMQELLTGKRRLPGFRGAWEQKRLRDICGHITTGKLDANAMVENGEYPFFTCARERYFIDKYAFDADALLVSGNGANVGYIVVFANMLNSQRAGGRTHWGTARPTRLLDVGGRCNK